ncbi:toxin [Cellulomonas chengniuliangii]|uniref:Toxin n=1 Tax=Cellulomonas chengniuliangii TaxID=2968084 RepID=A0ABY5L7I1_9CELL|nr:toxin [Cellulomonas chengniuliangii]MCC2308159.1 toxin [Cellulomonas chengniuliangii]UUI76553.1 toxin [Cellulomonas chengniuliangii]
MPEQPRRVRVVGNSGSGKTTFARRLAVILGVPHLELDEVFWAADWTKRDVGEARAVINGFVSSAHDGWVADGNWAAGTEGMLEDADAFVWLDYPRRTVMPRVIRRTLRRGLLRTELWHGNREDLRNLVSRDPEQNVVLWSWTAHTSNRARYAALAAESSTPVVCLRRPRDARRWLATLSH